jgi:hypothetical protein
MKFVGWESSYFFVFIFMWRRGASSKIFCRAYIRDGSEGIFLVSIAIDDSLRPLFLNMSFISIEAGFFLA